MKKFKLNRKEKEIESGLVSGEYKNAGNMEFSKVADAIRRRKKDLVSSRTQLTTHYKIARLNDLKINN